MKNRIVKLNETDLEKLVQKILKEDGDVTTGKNPFKSTGDETITLDFIKEYIIEAIEYYDEGYDESMAEGVDALSRMIMGNIKDDISYVSENYEGEIEAIVMDDWRDWFGSHKYLREEESELNQGSQTKVERVIDSATMEALIKMIKSKGVDDQINIVMQILNPMDLKGSFGRGLKMALDRAVKNTPN